MTHVSSYTMVNIVLKVLKSTSTVTTNMLLFTVLPHSRYSP